jgi:hypothetical protein
LSTGMKKEDNTLHKRIAYALNWTEEETHSFSLPALRELVRPISPKLYHEITLAMGDMGMTCR